jgi:rhamnose utilization protein RhaD (predicted bifunctional aldolase and dehydrogenase)
MPPHVTNMPPHVANMRAQVAEYCAAIGMDRLLVQGAGGNVSWKEGATLWIKASGTWLADAARKDIFVPVDLRHLQGAIARGHFDAVPRTLSEEAAKPSIETVLHALMPHPVVVHLHAVDILARLVRRDCKAELAALLGDSPRWTSVDYLKPGAELARSVSDALERTPGADMVFLLNHGVLLGGEDVADIDALLGATIELLKAPERRAMDLPLPSTVFAMNGGRSYAPVPDAAIQQLALDGSLFARLETDWALYPDHVVFLGAEARCYDSMEALIAETALNGNIAPELAFVRNTGVFAAPAFSPGKLAQLRCYCDVLARQSPDCALNALAGHHVAELLDWDAERYRMRLARHQ